jgi:hypothetical protein
MLGTTSLFTNKTSQCTSAFSDVVKHVKLMVRDQNLNKQFPNLVQVCRKYSKGSVVNTEVLACTPIPPGSKT